jgi:type II restriction enzyme
MSQSNVLRNSVNQHAAKNVESKFHDADIIDISYELSEKYKLLYPGYEFGVDKKIPITILKEMAKSNIQINDKSYLKPDGGLSWIKINGKKHFYLFPEQKRQGTNDKRLTEGKEKQSQGNASERIADKLCVSRLLFGDEDICPFVAFLQGCDFYEPESTIPDRIKRAFNFTEPNVIHYEWMKLQKHNSVGGSYFMRGHSMKDAPGSSDWSTQEMYNITDKISRYSIDYYIKKYDK